MATTAKAASCLIDLLSPEYFANQAVEFVRKELGGLTEEQATLVQVGALAGARSVATELREFAERDV